MCGKTKNAQLLEAMRRSTTASAAPARERKAAAARARARARSGRHGVAAAAGGKQKLSSPWTGLRFRPSGKWATEIRVPRTREKVWIGTFPCPRLAALAYDAAVFCFYGERTPKARRVNFPAAPRPEIDENARLRLSIADVKAIAEKHARHVNALLPPLDTAAASPDDDLVVVVAPAATPVPVDAPCACARKAGGLAAPPPDSLYEEDDPDRLINDFDIDAFQELDALTFLVSDDELVY